MTLPTLVAELRRDLVGRRRPDPLGGRGGTGAPRPRGRPRRRPRGVVGAARAQRRPTAARPRRAGAGLAVQGRVLRPVRAALAAAAPAAATGRRWAPPDIGTLVHDIAAELGDADEAALRGRGRAPVGPAGHAPGLGLRPQAAGGRTRMVGRLSPLLRARPSARAGNASAPRLACRSPSAGRSSAAASTGSSGCPTARCGSSTTRRAVGQAARGRPAHPPAARRLPGGGRGGAFAEHGSTSGGAALLQLGKAANKRDDDAAGAGAARTPTTTREWAHELVAETADGMAGGTFTRHRGATGASMCPVKARCPAQPEGRQL